jgi:hypothetical protein
MIASDVPDDFAAVVPVDTVGTIYPAPDAPASMQVQFLRRCVFSAMTACGEQI